MAELSTIARPYAKAAFQLAKEQDQLASWTQSLAFLAELVANEKIEGLLFDPKSSAKDKAKVLIELCDQNINESCQSLIELLARNNRLQLISAIFLLFLKMLSSEENVADVEVFTAEALSDAQEESIKTALKSKLNKAIKLTVQVDESLIGGVLIRADDLVIDGSVKGKLAKMANTLNL